MKPAVSTAMIRRKIRTVLQIRPGFGKTEAFLLESVNELTGGGVSLDELREAVEWNLGEALIRGRYDEESETKLWFITAAGIAKDNI